MIARLNNIVKGPALSGLLCVLLLASCASTQRVERPAKLEDQSAESAYDLAAVSNKLNEAEKWANDGKRALAALIYDAAIETLPESKLRERIYVRAMKAAMLGRQGEGRDEEQARSQMQHARLDAMDSGALNLLFDRRFKADLNIAEATIECGAGQFESAESLFKQAQELLSETGAHAHLVEAQIGLAYEFEIAGQADRAERLASEAMQRARRLDDDTMLPVAAAAAGLLRDAEREQVLIDGYEAAYRSNDLWWRNVMIALAVQLHFDCGNWDDCVRWGDRMRDRDVGGLPESEDTGLYPEDGFLLLARYARARRLAGAEKGRTLAAYEDALEAWAKLDESEMSRLAGWEQKLRSGLLQLRGD
ncbi:MAG: hypothetical protein IPK87_16720 [Planctomycetes bacterium]|nr:hypothetical protein [Planctomycetota bacterium]